MNGRLSKGAVRVLPWLIGLGLMVFCINVLSEMRVDSLIGYLDTFGTDDTVRRLVCAAAQVVVGR